MKGTEDDVTKTDQGPELAANQDELVVSSVVSWHLPSNTNTADVHSDSKHTEAHNKKTQDEEKMPEVATDSLESCEKSDEEHMDHSKSPGSKSDTVRTQTHVSELNHLPKDQQLQEEERLLLAKIRLMTGDSSPVSGPRFMKRLIPALDDIDCDPIEAETPLGLVDHSQRSIVPCFEDLEEISEALTDDLKRSHEGEEDA